MGNRVVLDTNIWVSYMITAKYDELECMLTNNVHFLRSAPSFAELQEVLSRKKFQKYNVDVEKLWFSTSILLSFAKRNRYFKIVPTPKITFFSTLLYKEKQTIWCQAMPKFLQPKQRAKILKITTLKSFKENIL